MNEERDSFQTWRGELYLEKHQGTLTSQARSKLYNRKMEKAARELEFASVLVARLGRTYPSETLETIWKEVLLYQFHDILPGSSIKRVYDESLVRYKESLSNTEAMIAETYRYLADHISHDAKASPGIVVFNSRHGNAGSGRARMEDGITLWFHRWATLSYRMTPMPEQKMK